MEFPDFLYLCKSKTEEILTTRAAKMRQIQRGGARISQLSLNASGGNAATYFCGTEIIHVRKIGNGYILSE